MVPPIVVWVRLGSLALPVPQAPAAAETRPIPLTCKHLVEPVPAEDRVRFVVDALVVERVVDVAKVLVENALVRLVIVLVELLTKIPLRVVVGERMVLSVERSSQALPKVSLILA